MYSPDNATGRASVRLSEFALAVLRAIVVADSGLRSKIFHFDHEEIISWSAGKSVGRLYEQLVHWAANKP